MKKTILILAALLLVVSGVAAVSAYEGHLVNIKAHVENAIGVETYELDFGTVFPQEELEKNLTFGLSESFVDAGMDRLSSLTYNLYYELKPIPDTDPVEYYTPLNPFLILTDGDLNDGNDTFVTQPVAAPTVGTAVLVGSGILTKVVPEPFDGPTGDLYDIVHIAFNVPVFEGWYNEITDPKAPWAYMLMDGEFVIEDEVIAGNIAVEVPHADLGIDLKIQIMSFVTHVPN